MNFPQLSDLLNFKISKISLQVGFEITVVMIVSSTALIFNIFLIYSKFERNSYDLKIYIFIFTYRKIFILYLCFFPLVFYGGYLVLSQDTLMLLLIKRLPLINLFFWIHNYSKYINVTNKDFLYLIELISYLTLVLSFVKVITACIMFISGL